LHFKKTEDPCPDNPPSSGKMNWNLSGLIHANPDTLKIELKSIAKATDHPGRKV